MEMAKARVTKDIWIEAAVRAISRGGVAAVAVDALAAELGITRGSFYWHFTDREALLHAALAHWERVGTEGVIAALDAEPDPARRLHLLFEVATADDGAEGFEAALTA